MLIWWKKYSQQLGNYCVVCNLLLLFTAMNIGVSAHHRASQRGSKQRKVGFCFLGGLWVQKKNAGLLIHKGPNELHS